MHSSENHKRRRQRVQMKDNGKSAHVIRQKESEPPREATFELAEGTIDVTGATFALRNRAIEVGKEYAYPVFTGSRSFLMRARVDAKETIQTPLGAREAFRMRVYTEFNGKLQSKRDMVAWLSTDPSLVPVRIEAEFALGTVVAELADYKPGRTVALTPAAPGTSITAGR
jgi:hypothetical protein